ncbi:DUF418 domain-containing protein [Nonomuraea mesophila]|uniref:DUF418 domain-containing protein n=2 Tax=Nonomuraea mesophila TaxID=2530382 RepID=A0A4R5FU06_9ACTN|nr:DUF418 domain-containing protein [Nonomuraea mesophila]
MLLAIAYAHAPLYVKAVDGTGLLNDVLAFLHQLLINNHARPMFAFLFGYSLVQLLNRQLQRGNDWVSVRKLLRRRGWWLLAIGFVHVMVIVPLDILAPYGIAALLCVGLLRAKDRTLLWLSGIALVPSALMVGFAMWYPLSEGTSAYEAGNIVPEAYGAAELLMGRLVSWPFGLVIGVIMVIPGVFAGIWAARRRLLEEPVEHRTLLIRISVITTAVSLLGSVPAGLMQAGWWTAPSGTSVLVASLLQPFTGHFGGIGLAAIMGLAAIPVIRRPNALATALQALGQRSMSLYLFQSVVFVTLFFPYGLNLQHDLGLAGATGVATATWLASLLIADLMRRAGHRGPAEILLRRLAYR